MSTDMVLPGGSSLQSFTDFVIVFAWNCQGIGNKEIVRALKDMVFKHIPDVFILVETQICDDKVKKTCVVSSDLIDGFMLNVWDIAEGFGCYGIHGWLIFGSLIQMLSSFTVAFLIMSYLFSV